MPVHGVRAREHLPEALRTDRDGDRQADAGPHGIAPTDPIPEAEGGGDAELCGGLHVGGERREMAGHVLAAVLLEPLACRTRVGHGLQRREGLGSDKEQGVLRTQAAQHRGQFMPVDVGDEMEALAFGAIRLQRKHSHLRTQVRAADADVDDVGDARVRAHLFGKREHRIQGPVHLHRVGVPGIEGRAQQPMLHRPVLGAVDALAREHRVARAFHAAFTCKIQQQPGRFRLDQVLRQVGKDMRRFLAEGFEARRVLRERAPQVRAAAFALEVGVQLLPGCGFVAADTGCHGLRRLS
jgi:hypothetical protein